MHASKSSSKQDIARQDAVTPIARRRAIARDGARWQEVTRALNSGYRSGWNLDCAPDSAGDRRMIHCVPSDTKAGGNRSLSYFTSGRVRPNPFLQQAYSFTPTGMATSQGHTHDLSLRSLC